MDKEEYKLKLQQINELADAGKFDKAADIVDMIDWRHVKSVRTLCMVSEIYEANKRNEDALRILKFAYRRSPSSKTVLYRLAEVSLKTGNADAARDYTSQFKDISPNDTSGYVLEYKISRAEGYPVSDQIRILRKLKDHEYSERWAYELARLYLKDGQEDKCVEECDDLILWFSEGRYVRKAMELKMEVRPLSAAQQARYDGTKKSSFGPVVSSAGPKADNTPVNASEIPSLAASVPDRREIFEGASSEEVQSQLADSIRSVFSGIQNPDQMPVSDGEEAAEEFSEDDLHSYIKSHSDKYSSDTVKSLEPESNEQGAVVQEGTPIDDKPVENIRIKAAEDQTASETAPEAVSAPEAAAAPVYDKEAEEKSMAELLTEMNASFARQIAEGDFSRTDEIQKDVIPTTRIPLFPEQEQMQSEAVEKVTEEAEQSREPEIPAAPVFTGVAATAASAFEESLADLEREEAKEDENSLGLTREFNFSEELKKAMAGGATIREAARDVSRKAAEEASGATESVEPTLPQDTSDLPAELFADTGEINAEEVAASAGFMDMDDVETGTLEPEKSIVEDMMEAPETVEKLPIEGRPFTDDEKKIFTYFAPVPGIAQQVTEAIADIHNNSGDKTSRSGNIVMMGRPGAGKTKLADDIVLAVCSDLKLEGARIAHIGAKALNSKDPAGVVSKLAGGFLIIEDASSLSEKTVSGLSRAMEFRTDDLVVILEDERTAMMPFLEKYPDFAGKFSSYVTIPVFTNDELVTFGRTYTKERGYKMDEMCVLALYTVIGDNQKDSEPVTVGKVQEMIDAAIARASKGGRRLSRKFSRKETDRDGRIILHEKDFDF